MIQTDIISINKYCIINTGVIRLFLFVWSFYTSELVHHMFM